MPRYTSLEGTAITFRAMERIDQTREIPRLMQNGPTFQYRLDSGTLGLHSRATELVESTLAGERNEVDQFGLLGRELGGRVEP